MRNDYNIIFYKRIIIKYLNINIKLCKMNIEFKDIRGYIYVSHLRHNFYFNISLLNDTSNIRIAMCSTIKM